MQKTHDNNGPKVRLKTVNIHSCERLRDAMCNIMSLKGGLKTTRPLLPVTDNKLIKGKGWNHKTCLINLTNGQRKTDRQRHRHGKRGRHTRD